VRRESGALAHAWPTDHPVCRRPARQGSGPGRPGLDAAPYWTNDLDVGGLVCWARPGRWRAG